MDSFVADFDGQADADLMLCHGAGVAYQRDMHARSYDDGYLAKIGEYDRSIAQRVNDGRCALVARHADQGCDLLDIGAGDGAFVYAARSWGFEAKGFDVIPKARDALLGANLFDDEPAIYDAVTMWDSLEHMEDPGFWLRRVRRDALLFVSVPIFPNLKSVRDSKHYRPGEHLYYFTAVGFIAWLSFYGFRVLEESEHETKAGRESIGAFAFIRDR